MAQKLWEKNVRVNEEIDRFTVGRDREMDLYLAKHDVLGLSLIHISEEQYRSLSASMYNLFPHAMAEE